MCHLYVSTVDRPLRGYLLFVSSSRVIDDLLWYFPRQFILYIKPKTYNSKNTIINTIAGCLYLVLIKSQKYCSSQRFHSDVPRHIVVECHAFSSLVCMLMSILILFEIFSWFFCPYRLLSEASAWRCRVFIAVVRLWAPGMKMAESTCLIFFQFSFYPD